jgi:hypothetical protein
MLLAYTKVSVKTRRPGCRDRRQLQGQEGSPNKYSRFTNYIGMDSLGLFTDHPVEKYMVSLAVSVKSDMQTGKERG